jgi:hypothetical protein
MSSVRATGMISLILMPRCKCRSCVWFLRKWSKGSDLSASQREQAIKTTLEVVERIRQKVRKVGFWKNEAMRELLTKALVRDLNKAGVCRPGGERDLAQRLVALAAVWKAAAWAFAGVHADEAACCISIGKSCSYLCR